MFVSDYNNTEQKLSAHFTALEVLLHQQAMCSLLQFAQSLQDALAPTPQSPQPLPGATTKTVVTADTAALAFANKKTTTVLKAAEKLKGKMWCQMSLYVLVTLSSFSHGAFQTDTSDAESVARDGCG